MYNVPADAAPRVAMLDDWAEYERRTITENMPGDRFLPLLHDLLAIADETAPMRRPEEALATLLHRIGGWQAFDRYVDTLVAGERLKGR